VTYGPPDLASGLVTDWKERAACAGYPSNVFFPMGDAHPGLVARAKAVCRECPVSEECLEFAFETNQVSGIWGGTTEEERRSLRRKWLTARRRTA
jgi:WhiB family redox-sensing transcriptional regulator